MASGANFTAKRRSCSFFLSFSAEARVESESEVGQLEGEIGASYRKSDTVHHSMRKRA